MPEKSYPNRDYIKIEAREPTEPVAEFLGLDNLYRSLEKWSGGQFKDLARQTHQENSPEETDALVKSYQQRISRAQSGLDALMEEKLREPGDQKQYEDAFGEKITTREQAYDRAKGILGPIYGEYERFIANQNMSDRGFYRRDGVSKKENGGQILDFANNDERAGEIEKATLALSLLPGPHREALNKYLLEKYIRDRARAVIPAKAGIRDGIAKKYAESLKQLIESFELFDSGQNRFSNIEIDAFYKPKDWQDFESALVAAEKKIADAAEEKRKIQEEAKRIAREQAEAEARRQQEEREKKAAERREVAARRRVEREARGESPNEIITVENAINPYREAFIAGGITAPDMLAERRDIEINFADILRADTLKYKTAGLAEWERDLESVVNRMDCLTPDKIEIIEQEIKDGAIPIFMPGRQTQIDTAISQMKECFKPLWIINGEEQSINDSYVWEEYYKNFQRGYDVELHQKIIQAYQDVPERPYITLSKPSQAPEARTTNLIVSQQRTLLTNINKQRGKEKRQPYGAMLPHEYGALEIIFGRRAQEQTVDSEQKLTEIRPIDSATWTRFISEPVSGGYVPNANFNPCAGYRRVKFGRVGADFGSPNGGFRLSVRVEI